MPGERRTKSQRLADRAKIASLALFGNPTEKQIADKLGLSQPTVHRELKIIREEWQQSARRDMGEIIAQELRKLDAIEMQALLEWERSRKDGEKRRVEERPTQHKGEDGKPLVARKENIETWGQCGDPRYLQVILGAQERRAKLLGIDKPQKVAPTDPDGNELPQGPVIVALPAQLDAETWAQAFSRKSG